jgi:hypothetical protein
MYLAYGTVCGQQCWALAGLRIRIRIRIRMDPH